jgi:hypothetical protein
MGEAACRNLQAALATNGGLDRTGFDSTVGSPQDLRDGISSVWTSELLGRCCGLESPRSA